MPSPLLERRVALLTGKGGVGKSTVVAALAVAAARRGLRPLVVELGHRASAAAIFGAPAIGHAPRPVGRGVFATNVDHEAALYETIRDAIGARALARAITRNGALKRLFAAAPAVRELTALRRIARLAAERSHGGPRFAPILVDLDATGHAQMYLSLPRLLRALVAQGPLQRPLAAVTGLLTDPRDAALVLVSSAAALPVRETVELHDALARGRDVEVTAVLVNQTSADPLTPAQRQELDAFEADARARGDVERLEDAALARQAIAEHQECVARLEALRARVDVPVVTLPKLPGVPELEALGELACAALEEVGL